MLKYLLDVGILCQMTRLLDIPNYHCLWNLINPWLIHWKLQKQNKDNKNKNKNNKKKLRGVITMTCLLVIDKRANTVKQHVKEMWKVCLPAFLKTKTKTKGHHCALLCVFFLFVEIFMFVFCLNMYGLSTLSNVNYCTKMIVFFLITASKSSKTRNAYVLWFASDFFYSLVLQWHSLCAYSQMPMARYLWQESTMPKINISLVLWDILDWRSFVCRNPK